jgi:hypothetical protein
MLRSAELSDILGRRKFDKKIAASRITVELGEQAFVVEPVGPRERGHFDRFQVRPAAATDEFGRVQPDDRLGQRIVEESPPLPTDGSMLASRRRSV